MAEGVGVSDEQLDEWDEDTRASVLAFGSSRSNERVIALIGEVRASHAREAEAVADRDELMAEVTTAARRIREAEAERDVLQQRIDKALETIADWEHVNDPDNFWARSVRAAVTGAGDQPIEETP